MSAASYWTAFYWKCFSQPRSERSLYKRIERNKPCRIVEFGLGNGSRSLRTIRMANRVSDSQIQYCGIDPFESRVSDPLPLKQAHQQLATTGAKVRLVPGDLFSGLSRTANLLLDSDLLIIDAAVTQSELESVFHLFPRMVHSKTQIARFDQTGGKVRLRWLKPDGFLNSPSEAKKAA